ncbi:hypothetical protein [Pedobacter sp. Hv1]|uniref:hypothetical protein n=1 Tax=Pedobacter sp. Hv1 TaxID=1740090 RepID=UPI0006D8C01B|nr:hypothetical protein [Pedobacter sp. Hv1]KQB99844.1 hypothetical protein AQF98_15115 [Pedobacter sp. Hv1]
MSVINARLSGHLRNVKENYPFALVFDKERIIATEEWSAEELSFIELFAELNYAFISGLHQAYKTLQTQDLATKD